MHWNYYGGDHGIIGWIMMLLFWGLVIWGAYALLTKIACGQGPKSTSDTAEELVRKRYARGEISREELEEKLKVLRS
ncbi:MAG: hypothetical protein OEV91_07650 [Desulfobulbaceae bacterium]|nr:hypothetical protein [Desulfobulbaceae bacterium]